MNYIHTQTKVVESIHAIRAANPRTSIPDGADLTALGYAQVFPAPPPTPGQWQTVAAAPPIQVAGKWYEAYAIEPMPNSEIVTAVTSAVQLRLDDFARTRNYDGILSACTYANSTVPKFASEGQYAVNARDMTWATCYQIMAAVQSNQRPMPTVDQVLSELPTLSWPA